MRTLVLRAPLADDRDLATVRQMVVLAGSELGLGMADQTQFATAASEIARNVLVHGEGGEVEIAVTASPPESFLELLFCDRGPGIDDLEGRLALPGSHGLALAQRFSDRFEAANDPGGGSRVVIAKQVPGPVPTSQEAVAPLRETILARTNFTALDLVRQQNHELAHALSALGEREAELAARVTEITGLYQELEESNRGLLAMHQRLEEKSELLQLATAEKSRFLASMSHEIRTPMNAVIAMTLLLTDTRLTPEQREFVETVHTSAEHLLTLIDDILDLSKIEAGKVELAHSPFEIRACIEDAVEIVAPRAAGKNLELAYAVDDRVPPCIVGDEARLRQILTNLLSNAVKFTEAGEVTVTATSAAVDGGRHRLQFDVRDTGIGIDADEIQKLFDAFTQSERTRTRVAGGTGLGLAICRQLSELMGGGISAESTPEVGSTFTVTVLADQVPAPSPGGVPELLRGVEVLVVDDHPMVRRQIERSCRDWGMAVVACTSTADALEAAECRSFDLAIVDLDLPDAGALTLVSALRERAANGIHVVGLAPNGAAPANAVADALTAKPIRTSQLQRSIERLLRPDVEPVAVSARFDPSMGSRHPLSILVAEDNAVNQLVAARLLERLGYEATFASTGTEAVEAACSGSFDLVLMDVHLPEMDGIDAAGEIRSRGSTVRIVAVTASPTSEERDHCLAAGMDGFLPKPIAVEALVAALEETPSRRAGTPTSRS